MSGPSPVRVPSRPWTDGLGAAWVWVILIIPPLKLRFIGRGGDLYPVELLVPLVALVVLWRRGFRLPSCGSLNAFALFIAACLPGTLRVSDPARHLYGLLLFGIAVLLLYAVASARLRGSTLDHLIRLSPLPFIVVAAVVIVTAWARGLLDYSGQAKLAIAYGGSNFLASMLLLGAYAPLAIAIGGDHRCQRLSALLVFALLAGAIIVTGSRIAMSLLPVGCVLTAIVLWRSRGVAFSRLLGPVAALGIVLLILMPYLEGMLRLGRFRDPLEQHNWIARLMIFELYWNQFMASPWVGNGLFNVRASPALTLFGEGMHGGWGAHVGAHNWLLQSLADAGIAGGLGFVLFLVAAGRTFSAGLRRSHRWSLYSVGWMAGFLTVVLHGLVEPNFHGKPFIYLFAVLLGLAEQIRRLIEPGALAARAANPIGVRRRLPAGRAQPVGDPPSHPGTALA